VCWLIDTVRVLGPDHPHTLAARRDVAYWIGECGRLEEAVRLLEDVLAGTERVLAGDHLSTTMTPK
jgi:hypothetical protein